MVVTRWTDARIPWPLAVPAGPGRVGRSSVLVDEELARAIRQVSAAALRHWWGVSVGLVWRWRKALGVTRTNNPSSGGLIRAAAREGGAAMSECGLTPEEVDGRRHTAVEKGLGRNLRLGYHGPWWSPEQLALLGKLPDEDAARRVGLSSALCGRSGEELGIPNPCRRLRPWTPAVVTTSTPDHTSADSGGPPSSRQARRMTAGAGTHSTRPDGQAKTSTPPNASVSPSPSSPRPTRDPA